MSAFVQSTNLSSLCSKRWFIVKVTPLRFIQMKLFIVDDFEIESNSRHSLAPGHKLTNLQVIAFSNNKLKRLSLLQNRKVEHNCLLELKPTTFSEWSIRIFSGVAAQTMRSALVTSPRTNGYTPATVRKFFVNTFITLSRHFRIAA